MEDLSGFLNRTAGEAGFVREAYGSGSGEVLAVPAFCDRRHEFALSVFIHDRVAPGRRLVVFGPPGRASLFPAAAEYWGLTGWDGGRSVGWESGCSRAAGAERRLARRVEVFGRLDELYNFGFKSDFFAKFGRIVNRLPAVPGLRTDLASRVGGGVAFFPNRFVVNYNKGFSHVGVNRQFYLDLVEGLRAAGHIPVILQNASTHDISPFVSGCVVLSGLTAADEMAILRRCFLLDLFSGDSRLALLARSASLTVADRVVWNGCRDYEVDDLVSDSVLNSYIFLPLTMLESNSGWADVVSAVVSRLPSSDLELPPGDAATFAAPYERLRERKSKRFGFQLFKKL